MLVLQICVYFINTNNRNQWKVKVVSEMLKHGTWSKKDLNAIPNELELNFY